MFTVMIPLILFATPLVAMPTSCHSLEKRGTTLELEIFMNLSALANTTALQGLSFWQTNPGCTYDVAMGIDRTPGYTFGDGLEEATWTQQVLADKMTVLYLDSTSDGPTGIKILRSGPGNDMKCNVTLLQEIEIDKLAWILDRGIETFFVDGKRGPAPGNDTLDIRCEILD